MGNSNEIISIFKDKCTKCGLCVKSCPSRHISIKSDEYPKEGEHSTCIDCGHCVSICPTDAIINNRMDIAQFQDMIDPEISSSDLTHLIRNRRSIRNYKDTPISQEHIDILMNSVRYIPTGSNAQSLRYTIITDPEKLDAIKNQMYKKFKFLNKLLHSFPVKYFVDTQSKASLHRLVLEYEKGNDTFLRGAPCFIIIHSKSSYFGISSLDAGIASHNLDLMAQTLGIGTLHNGFFVTTSKLFKSIKKAATLHKKRKILAAVCLGYPKYKYQKTVSRKKLSIKRY